MEFGSPPLYAELNRVCRDMDLRYLSELGPYAMALFKVCEGAENRKNEEEKIATGMSFSKISYNLSGCFLLWRGAQMKQEWIDPFIQSMGSEWIYLKGNTSCSRNPLVALKFAFSGANDEDGKKSVLFLKCMRNCKGVKGIMMNSEAYSAYPDEGELLLTEGYPVKVIGHDQEV